MSPFLHGGAYYGFVSERGGITVYRHPTAPTKCIMVRTVRGKQVVKEIPNSEIKPKKVRLVSPPQIIDGKDYGSIERAMVIDQPNWRDEGQREAVFARGVTPKKLARVKAK